MSGPRKTTDNASTNAFAADFELGKELMKIRVHALLDEIPAYKFKDKRVRDVLMKELTEAISDPVYDRKTAPGLIAAISAAMQENKFTVDTPPALKRLKAELVEKCKSYTTMDVPVLEENERKQLQDDLNALTLKIVRAMPDSKDVSKKICMVNAVRSCRSREELQYALNQMSEISKQIKAVVNKVSAPEQRVSTGPSLFRSVSEAHLAQEKPKVPQQSKSDPVKSSAPPRPTTPYPKRK